MRLLPVVAALLLAACPAPPPQPCDPTRLSRTAPPSSAPASAPTETSAVVADPAFLEQYAATFRFRLGHPKSFALTPGGERVLFLRSAPRSFSHDLYSYDTRTGASKVLLTASRILAGAQERLSAEERARRERMRVLSKGIVSFKLSQDGARLLVPLSGRLFVIGLVDGKVRELKSVTKAYPIDARLSPDGKLVSCVRDGDLYLHDPGTGKQRRLTRRPSRSVENGLAEFVAQEEMRRHRGYWWSPDSKQLLYQQTDTSKVERLHILDPARPESKPHRWAYPRAGRTNASVRLGLVSTRGGRTRWIRWDRQRFPYLVNVRWSKGAPLTLVVQDRKQTTLALLTADPLSGKTRQLLEETDAAWVNIDPQMPRWLPDGTSFLWTTERRGAWQLELRGADGKLLRELTRTDLGYRKLLDLSPKANEVFVLASPAGATTERQIVRLPLKGPGKLVQVTRARGAHDAHFARGHQVYVHTLRPLKGQRSFTVRRRDGTTVGTIVSKAERPPFAPNLELVRLPAALEGGAQELDALVIRPRNFSADRRYPVVVYVYGGPNHQVVAATADRYLLQQWIADHGFIVVSIDGRGTPGRGRRWERVIKGNLIKVPLADQVAGLRALGARYKELDLSRVGIYGWSFGGYFAAMAALRRPELFRAAVAVAPVSDWQDYDTHYTERYLGLPKDNPAGYRDSSVLTHAPRLTRPLLLIHGTADDNVYFTHSIKLSDRLFRAGKPHGFLPLTGFTHLVPDPLVTRRLFTRIAGFFGKEL
jgi:dipeptidyl-peptidase-4